MDNLERYIKEHREAFDSEEPSDKVWEAIKSTPIRDRSPGVGNWMWKAAAIFLLLTTSYLAADKWLMSDTPSGADASLTLGDDFYNAESYYLLQIDHLRSQLDEYSEEELLSEEFLTDLHHLDNLYDGLKAELKEGGNSEMVADAMIQNLMIRLEIINKQLMILETVKRQTSDVDIEI